MRRNILTQAELSLLAAPFGTKEWAINKKRRIEEKIDAAQDDIIYLDAEAVDFINEESWCLLENEEGKPYGTFKQFALAERPYGLGCTEKQFRVITAICAPALTSSQESALHAENPVAIHGTNRFADRHDNYHVYEEQGTSSEYLTARIARDRPEIYADMIRGKYRSVRQAAIEAGIIHPRQRYSLPDDPQAAGRYLAQRVDKEWLLAMVDEAMKSL